LAHPYASWSMFLPVVTGQFGPAGATSLCKFAAELLWPHLYSGRAGVTAGQLV
jgi:hypothetical protein